MSLKIEKNKLYLAGKELLCPFKPEVIEKIIDKDGKLIVLIVNADGTSCPPRNILCYDHSGKLVWQIASPIKRSLLDHLLVRRTDMVSYSDLYLTDDKLAVSLSAGYEYFVNFEDGSLTERFPGQRPW